MNNVKHYNREISEAYGTGARDFVDFFRNAHEFLDIDRKRFLESMPERAKILDCGCGPGQDSEVFAKLGYTVTGIDITPEFIAMAKQRVPAADFIQMDMRAINLPADTFDGIWVSFSLLHIHKTDVPQVLRNFITVMKSTGRMMIALHRGPKTEWVTANISGINRHCAVQEWVQSDLEQVIRDNGFAIEYSRAFERSGGRFPLLSIIGSISGQ
ncbi:MAG: class I SAM-dependent methyltransferase [Burkholderiales bacterium]|nr:class I SAM-dependent methyltransferase [Nitrosomonas sp.]MCP5274239.1 class I SAM-dependent methyltransferase [Burkholderiales bacterium]